MIDKIIEQQETIKGMQENEENTIKIMKMYEDYKLRVDKAIKELINIDGNLVYGETSDRICHVIDILKGE